MKKSISAMSIRELRAEHQTMVEAESRLRDTSDQAGLEQLRSVRALKFALMCQIDVRLKQSAPRPGETNVVSLDAYRIRREPRGNQVS